MQFGFCPGKGTTDAIFIVRQVQEKFLGKQKEMWMAFVDLEKAFDRVPREVLWWALRHVGVEEWMVNVIKSLYEGVTTAVKRNGEESESFEVKVGVHQGSVLSPILFNIVMQAIADNFKKGLPWELLYADDLVLLAESRLELEERLIEWMARLKEKGLRVNHHHFVYRLLLIIVQTKARVRRYQQLNPSNMSYRVHLPSLVRTLPCHPSHTSSMSSYSPPSPHHPPPPNVGTQKPNHRPLYVPHAQTISASHH